MKIKREWNWKVSAHGGRIGRHPEYDYLSGDVPTPLGYVQVYSDPRGVTTLQCIVNGREYTRSIDEFYSSRYLVTLAQRYIKEIHNRECVETEGRDPIEG